MNHIDTMKLALEALENSIDLVSNETREVEKMYANVPTRLARVQGLVAFEVAHEKAITALREALEQPAQKCSYPYCGCNSKAWCKVERNEALDKMAENARELGLDYEPAQKPVTPCTHPSLGFSSLREDGAASRWSCVMCGTEFVPKATQRWTEFNETTKRNIEHAEWYLSTHPQSAQQEPVAFLVDDDLYYPEEIDWESLQEQGHTVASLYTQAQRTWVGLTNNELQPIADEYRILFGSWVEDFARAIEAKLKEKNNG